MADVDRIRSAGELIEQARGEETEDGNPLVAVRHYTTAMEIIASEASKCAASISNDEARRFFLFQIRAKMEMYHERAELLLQVANGSGLLDKPNLESSSPAHLPDNYPPALFVPTPMGGDKNGAGDAASCGHDAGGSVLGIPLFQREMAGSTQAAADHDHAEEPSMSSYLKPSVADANSPPPVTQPLDLDELMRNLGAPPDS